jgi:hypothetical protein
VGRDVLAGDLLAPFSTRVTVVGFGSRFTDAQMGVSGDVVLDAELRRVFDLQFALLRELAERQPP